MAAFTSPVVDSLNDYYPFNKLSKETQKLVLKSLRLTRYSPGENVVEAKDTKDKSIFLVKSGTFEAYNPEDGFFIGESQMGPGAYFGERACLFDIPRTMGVRCSADNDAGGEILQIPGKVVVELFQLHETPFALALASRLRFDQRLFDNFVAFRSEVQSTINKSGQVDFNSLVESYKKLKPAIHSLMDSNEVDYSGWSYALNRLPDNVCSTYSVVLSRRLIGVLQNSVQATLADSVISQTSPGAPANIRDRRRTCWEVMPGKTFILLREVLSDFLDVITNLALHAIEANKFRKLCKPLSANVPHLQRGIQSLENATTDAEKYEIERKTLQACRKLGPRDLDGVMSLWQPGTVLENVVNLCIHHGDYTIMLDPASNNYGASADELWMKRLQAATKQVVGDFYHDDESLIVEIVSSNTHSVVNCLSPYVHANADKILTWGKDNLEGMVASSELADHDLLYPILRKYLDAHPGEVKVKREMDEECGIFEFPEKEMTGISTQLIDLNKLVESPYSCDPFVEEACPKSETRKPKRRHLLVNIDYCFGCQGEHIMRLLCLVYGRTINSINILGKAGGLTGNRGDILFPTHVVDEGSQGMMRSVDNSGVDAEKLQLMSGKCVHVGPIITVEGTLLQNRELLKFYDTLWHTTGMEMEATWYLRAIEQALMLDIIPSCTKTRLLYYVSDTPFKTGSSLSKPMTLAEGIPPLYAITRHILQLVMAQFHESATPVAAARNKIRTTIAQKWQKAGNILRAVHRATPSSFSSS